MSERSDISLTAPSGKTLSNGPRVEVMGRYLNHSDQGECLRSLLEIVPSGSKTAKTRTPRRVCRRLEPSKVEELIRATPMGFLSITLPRSSESIRAPFKSTLDGMICLVGHLGLGRLNQQKLPGCISKGSLWPSWRSISALPLTRWPLPCAEPGSHCDLGGDGSTNRSSSPLFRPRLSSAWRSPHGPGERKLIQDYARPPTNQDMPPPPD